MENYLQIAKTAVHNLTTDEQLVHVVMGNEACDLDSAVAALVYAFYLDKTKALHSTLHSAIIIPVLNIKRHELYLHSDVTYFLKDTGVPLSLLTFRDDLNLKALHAAQKLTLTLVDHNKLNPEDSFLCSRVTEIIDHHPKLEGRIESQRTQITLELVGSCCTLVAEKILLNADANVLDRQISLLLYGTILLDTICLNDAAKRVTAKDKNIAAKLHEFLPDVDRDELFRSLHKAKCDVSGLSVDELLRRDLKSTSNDTMKIAVSTISSSLKDFLQRPSTEIDLEKFSIANSCQIVVLMGVQVNVETMDVERQLAVYSSIQGYREQIVDMLEAVSTRGAKLCLQSSPSPYPTVVLYHQGNVAATRKVILPLLHTFLHGDRSPCVTGDASKNKIGCRPSANNNKGCVSSGSGGNNVEDDQTLADYDPLAAESEDVVPLNNPIGNPASQLHVLGMGDPMSHAGSSQSSNQNSCPYTPQNSCQDGGLELDPYARQILPSFNSREMMEKIESKRGKLRGYDVEGDSGDNTFYPFTPKNSFVDGSFEAYVKTSQVPSFDSGDFLLRVNEKVASMNRPPPPPVVPTASGDDDVLIGSVTVEVPQVATACNTRNGHNHHQDQDEHAAHDTTNSLDKPLPQKCPDEAEAASFSEHLDKSTEIMDTNETCSDKTSPFPNDLEQSMNCGTSSTSTSMTASTNAIMTSNDRQNNVQNNHTMQLMSSALKGETATSDVVIECADDMQSATNTISHPLDLDLDLAANYQTETVDFPDSPRQLKFLTQSTQGLSLEETVPEEEDETEQPEDEDFRAVLSPSSDGVKLKKEVLRVNNNDDFADGTSFDEYDDDDDDVCDFQKSSSLESLNESDFDRNDLTTSIEYENDQYEQEVGVKWRPHRSTSSTPRHLESKNSLAADFARRMSTMGQLSAIMDESNSSCGSNATYSTGSVKNCQQLRMITDEATVIDAVSTCLRENDVRNFYDLYEHLRRSLRPEYIKEIANNNQLYRKYFRDEVLDALDLITAGVLTSSTEEDVEKEEEEKGNRSKSRSIVSVDRSKLDQSIVERFGEELSTVLLEDKQEESMPKSPKSIKKDRDQVQRTDDLRFVPRCGDRAFFIELHEDQQQSPTRWTSPERPNTLTTTGMKKRKIKVNEDILNAAEDKEDERSWSSLSNRSDGDILTPGDDLATPDDIDTPDDLDDSVTEVTDPIPEVSAAEERDEERRWRTCVIGGVQRKIDLKVIEPYKKVLSHGGYYGPKRSAIIVFSACYLPDHGRKDYDYVMDNLFLYVLTTLDQLVAEDYVLVYLHGALDRSHMPTFGWLKRCYQMIDRRLRKNLKGLYLVHPTFWLKTIVLMTKPFISSKFSRKLQFVNTLQELADLIPVDQMSIPDKVKQLEFELMIKEKKRHQHQKSQKKEEKETATARGAAAAADSSSEEELPTNYSAEGACEMNYRRIQADYYAQGGFTGGWF